MRNTIQGQRSKISIEYIQDVICSWCPIGLRHVTHAIRSLSNQIDFELKFLPFELNPDMPPKGESIRAYFARRKGWSDTQFSDYAQTVVATAGSVGLIYDYEKRTHYFNTAKAHRLIDFAEQKGRQADAVDMLTNLYFQHGVDVSDTDQLLEIGTELDFDQTQLRAILNAAHPTPDLREKYQRVAALKVSSAPSLLINGTTFIQGSNSQEYFVKLFSDFGQSNRR